jgi:hypothetical protein
VARTIDVTVRKDGPRDATVLVHDENGNEVASVTVATGLGKLIFQVWKDEDTLIDTVTVAA